MADEKWIYEVAGSLPPQEGHGNTWRANFTCHVVAHSLEDAIDAVREHYPQDGVTLHKVQQRDRAALVLFGKGVRV